MPTQKIQILNGASIIPNPDWNQTDETKADFIKNKPAEVTDEHINSLIDAKLGVIENGSY